MNSIKLINIFLFSSIASVTALGQTNERTHLRRGNKLYKDSVYVTAEVEYRKALEANPSSTEAIYNLGNTLLMQQKAKEAMEQYETAAKIEKNPAKLAKIYHNAGVVLQASKQYKECIEAYKQALRNNPADDETRYNLALAQKQLKEQQQNQDNQNNQDNQEQQQKEQEKQDQQNKDQQQDQKEQDKQKEKEQEQQKQEEKNQQMSKENAEQLLNAVMQDEKDVQDKVKKQLQVKGKKYDKDW